MAELGNGKPKRAVDQNLSERVWQVFLGPDDVRDAHEGIVHGHAEVVHGHTPASQNDEVAEGVRVPSHLTADRITDGHNLVLGNTEADAIGITFGDPFRDFLLGRIGPRARVHGGLPFLLGLGLHGGEVGVRAEARVRHPLVHQLLRLLLVDAEPLALPVRAEVTSTTTSRGRALVPIQPKPPQILQDGALRLQSAPALVRVLNPEDELAVVSARE
mmetsp:Transcript_11651/g.29670  ORF Transcript_11651/g.29670 Transcript_11651/m.29670 type:complete len:216 (+) Transcript_11651:1990-2637(+)